MDYYIIIVPALALSLCMLLNLLVLRRRDKYLFAELQKSQDILSDIRENCFYLPQTKYHRLRNLIEGADEATALADPHPTSTAPNPDTTSKVAPSVGGKHPNAVSLAKRLLESHINRHSAYEHESPLKITDEELAWAEEILATHLDACLKQGIHPDLSEAVEDAIAFALHYEKAYEPNQIGPLWSFARIKMEKKTG
jgi:hypothetical protein